MSSDSKVFLDVYIGDRDAHASGQADYEATCALLSKNAAIYGLPSSPADLTEEQQQILSELDVLGLVTSHPLTLIRLYMLL